MKLDPTLADLQAALDASMPASLRGDGWAEDCQVAAYWFACHYHGGQWSNLYAALCSVPYDPKGLDLEGEGEGVRDAYAALQSFYQV